MLRVHVGTRTDLCIDLGEVDGYSVIHSSASSTRARVWETTGDAVIVVRFGLNASKVKDRDQISSLRGAKYTGVPLYRDKKYFMHGTSHHMGLDTHDYGLLHEPMKANMIFTVEPGIYIPEEKFGIRIEDNVVVQDGSAPFNLMRNIPIEVEEIESLMNA